ncbi:hypothetical protein [Mesorhizobium sp.]|uniref:hypothetical protein n=1 Tax=Mesorhizobium sp. TaxID=1871066 RepID=UPI00120F4C85|nr:hypothetical protein [Mesorhizobium sp.]TIO67758.1 MAG: aminotransferase class III-fold pyridoxal phosphate-dependent enzyme [Mesorhizobium sp.]
MIAPNWIVAKVVESGGFLHGYTYSGNPHSSTIGVAVLNELVNQNLMENAQRMGFLNAVEIIEDRAAMAILRASKQASYRDSEIARDLGLHIYSRRAASGKFGEWFMAAPPLIITEPEIDLFMKLLTKTFRIFESENR